jgi:hypothetical protein
MKVPAVSDRDRRAVLLGMGAIVGALVVLRGLPSLSAWRTRERQLAAESEIALADARTTVSLARRLHDTSAVRQLRARGMDSALVEGHSVSQAAANLARELSETAESVELNLEALQADSATDTTATVRRIRVRGSVSGELEALMQFLLLVETGPHLLAIRDIALTRRQAASASQAEVIQATFLIEGLMRPAVSPSTGIGTPVSRLVANALSPPAEFDGELLANAAEQASDRNIFRDDRGRTDIASHAEPNQVARPMASIPALTLRGIIGGPPWDAIIDGLPGRPAGTVVRDGESVGGFSFQITARESVRIKGADTSWTLTFRR